MKRSIAMLLSLGLWCCAGEDDGPPCVEVVCGDSLRCAVPGDPGKRGPWPVGARTVEVGGITTEVWYPAAFGSESGLDPVVYDVREALPDSEQGKVPDAATPWQPCDCYRDLALDAAHGPYPVLVFLHGIAAFRSQSLQQMEHWAGRGFVVLSQDHPGVWLKSMLEVDLNDADPAGDTRALLDAVAAGQGGLDFLQDRVDLSRIGLIGHSAGGSAVAELSDVAGVQVRVPMASGGVQPGAPGQHTLVLGAVDDKVVEYIDQVTGYEAAPLPRRLVGIANAGHLAFSDMCAMTNAQGQDLVEVALEYEIKNATLATPLWDGCDDGQTEPEQGWAIIDHVTTAVFEDVLLCTDASGRLVELEERFPLIEEYREEL